MAVTSVCLRFLFILLRINSFSFTRSTIWGRTFPCSVAIRRKSCSERINMLASASSSLVDCVRKSSSSCRTSIFFRILFTDVRMPSLFAILNCLRATVGELTMQTPPIKNTTTLGTSIMVYADAANPPVTNKHTAIVEAISFPAILGTNSSDCNAVSSSLHPCPRDDKLSVNLECFFMSRSKGSFKGLVACEGFAAASTARMPHACRIPDAMVSISKVATYCGCPKLSFCFFIGDISVAPA
mmetsp:Transcript_34134/g.71868  ORF Transcript_34134/g.71868 Transcript_34134/m.71868 type:complete len:241 (-) Transcript_34134:118-840(-)